ncbi:MAG: hypothetical protein QXO07_02120 [Candidatus Aenigmatarchaeota archaeon]
MKGIATVISYVLLFIVTIVAVYLLASGLFKNIAEIQGAIISREKIISDRLQSVIDIDSCSYENGVVSFYVTNRGNTILNPNLTKFFINGRYSEISISFAYKIFNDSAWHKHETLKISVFNLSDGIYSVKVVSNVGSYDEKIVYIYNNTCSLT